MDPDGLNRDELYYYAAYHLTLREQQQVSSSLGRDESLAPVCELVQHAGK